MSVSSIGTLLLKVVKLTLSQSLQSELFYQSQKEEEEEGKIINFYSHKFYKSHNQFYI
jgi:hypothetical protein